MNFKSEIKTLEDGTIDITVTVLWSYIEKIKDEIVTEHVKSAVMPGFRKGMAPKKMVEESLDAEHIKEDILRKVLPEAYADAIKTHKISPIISPRIHVEKLEDGKDWQFNAKTCEMPKVNLGDYKEDVKKLTAKGKIVVPGKDLPAGRQEPTPVSFEEIAKILIEKSKFTVPQVILDQEVERLLSQTLDEIKKLGLTLDQYLSSTGKTIESLKGDYAKKAENDVKLEFILQQIAATENITVEDKEIEEAIETAKTPEEKQNLSSNKYLLAGIIRQQKTLDFIRNL